MLNISYIPVIDEIFAARLREEALKIDPDSEIRGLHPGPQGAIEWALPPVIAFVLGGISAGILREAGKDLYHGLKKLIVEAYEEANRSPCEWQTKRKEPTLGKHANIEASAEDQPLSERPTTSPPLKLTLQTDEWNGKFSFIFFGDLTPEQVADAYDAIPKTAQAILEYYPFVFAQLKCKGERPGLYQGTMPNDIWAERLVYEMSEASALLHAVFVFDTEARIWVRVH